MGMDEGDLDAALLTSSMFVGDVIAGHGVTSFLEAAESAGCKTANGGHMVEAAQDVMADFMLRQADSSTGEGRATPKCHRHDQDALDAPIWTLADDNGSRAGQRDQP
jgi:hypothetical protein